MAMPTSWKAPRVRKGRNQGALEPDVDAAVFEKVAALLLVLAKSSDENAEQLNQALDIIERDGDAESVGVIAAMAALAPPLLADTVRAVLGRLHLAGIHAPVEEEVGTLRFEEAMCFAAPEGKMLMILLVRPCEGEQRYQMATVGLSQGDPGEHVVDGFITETIERSSFEDQVDAAAAGGKMPCQSVSADEVSEMLGKAFVRSVESNVAGPLQLGVAAPILALALTGDPTGFAAISVDLHQELPLAPENDEEFAYAVEELGELLAEVLDDDPEAQRYAPFITGTMLSYKWHYGDGRLAFWTTDDLDEYLLDHFPRKVSGDVELIANTPMCVAAFLEMLDGHDALEGQSLEELHLHLRAILDKFFVLAQDRSMWGPAKTTVMSLLDAGVDIEDEEAVRDWLSISNSGPVRVGHASRRANVRKRKLARASRKGNRR